MSFELPALPYEYSALEPYIDAQTMQIHHDKHHGAYITNLNTAMQSAPELASLSLEELLQSLSRVPDSIRMTVRNNAGGHANHSMFWNTMQPGGATSPSADLADDIARSFGSFGEFQATFNDAGLKRFGSGWAWLILNKDGKLQVTSSPNQDSPLMDGQVPILGNDVWEHAYYLKYQNRRADYLAAWWNVVNWDAVARRYADAKAMVHVVA